MTIENKIIPLCEDCRGKGLFDLSGIYKIVCLVNGKVYIGSSKNLVKRFNKHKRALIKGDHHSIALQNSFNKYGIGAFNIEILERCDVNLLQEREQFYIDIYQSFKRNKGYNIIKEAYRGTEGYTHTDETKKKISEATKRMWLVNRESLLASIKQSTKKTVVKKNTRQRKRIKRKHSPETILKIKNSNQRFKYDRDFLEYLYTHLNMKRQDMAKFLNATERTLKDNLRRMGIIKTKENFRDIMKKSNEYKRGKRLPILKTRLTFDTETGIYFDSLVEATQTLNLKYGNELARLYNNRLHLTRLRYA